MVVGQLRCWRLIHSHREQAHSYIEMRPASHRRFLWEPGLPAMAVGQLRCWRLTHRIREQARSHI